jgi:cytochrome b
MEWHQRSGLAILLLLSFRLLWGFVGSSTSRFANFLHGPRGVATYLRGEEPPLPGHNPLGGWSVIAMLVLLCLQVGTGLLAVDVDGIESGPLSYLVDFDQGRTAAAIHHTSFNILLGLIALHILAITFYLVVRRRNLVARMVTGRDPTLPPEVETMVRGKGWVLVAVLGVAMLFTWWISNGAQL